MPAYSYGQGQVGPGSTSIRPGEYMGMAEQSPYKWDPPSRVRETTRPIDALGPGTQLHAFVLNYLISRLNWAEEKMQQFYPRWQANEMRHQAYVTLPEYDRILQAMRDDRKPADPASIVVPYSWSAIATIVTYLLHTFGGRKPIIQVGSYRAEQVQRAKNMEVLLGYNCDFIRYIYHLYNLFTNGELYGVAIQRSSWTRIERMKTVTRPASPQLQYFMGMQGMGAQPIRTQERAVCFEGNSIASLSPFMFFPDPRVPMVEVAEKGEFVFWRTFEGRHMLLRAEQEGRLQHVKYAGESVRNAANFGNDSYAGLRAMGDPLTNGQLAMGYGHGVTNNIQVDQGTIEIIPAELGLGPQKWPEKWLFTILNKTQIVQAEPVNLNHGQHPIAVAEPNAFGHSFGQLATADLNAPIQDLMSWLVNSHMFNVRASLNNFLVVDPSRVEIDDLLDPQPGGILRLKSSPFGQPIDARLAVSQLQVGDVTRSHLTDFNMISQIGGDLTGASDNLRGRQAPGGRKTATEVRTSNEGGASRMAARAMLYGAMCISPGGAQMASNYQQFLTDEMELRVLGQEGRTHSVRITPEGIEGDYFFPIHDGTLPLDRVALVQSWMQLFQAIISDPTGAMQQQYNSSAMLRFIAQLSGLQNIDEFQTTAANPGMLQQQAQAGNLVPLSQLPGQFAANNNRPQLGITA